MSTNINKLKAYSEVSTDLLRKKQLKHKNLQLETS